MEKVLSLPEEELLDISEIKTVGVQQKKGKNIFEAERCEHCGELTFVNKLRLTTEGKLVCIPCSGYGD
ncbi:MAG: hypothetical protein M0Z75_11785 [Nitrospiraceae bacterium]|nr:hypothetical protein [Nitrospiraceae bacterium]